MNQTTGINLENLGPRPLDTAYPLADARGGTLFLADDSVANRLGTVPVTINGGTLVAAKGPTTGAGSQTVSTVGAIKGMARLIAAPAGGTFALNVGNLTRSADGTVDFRSAFGPLGGTGDNGQIKVAQINGIGFSSANLNNGLIGAWATAGDNFASYDNANGVIGNVTNVATDLLAPGPTVNVRNTSATNLNFPAGDLTVNSIITGADLIVPSSSTVTVQSGAAMMSGPNKWWQSSNNATPAFIQAGPEVSQMVFTVLDPGTDHRLRYIVKDNGATPLNFIKNGTGWLRLNEANTYTGQTIVNAGTLALNTPTSLGAGTLPVIIRSGATLDLQAQNVGNREVIVSGAGVSNTAGASLGALINNGAGVTNGVIRLTLVGDTTVGGTGRWDVRGTGAVVNGGTFTLTKVGGNQVSFVQPDSVSLGNIVINAGNLSFESKNEIMGSLDHTVTINPGGTLMLWNNIGTMTQSKPVVLNGGRILGQNNTNVLAGPIRIDATGTAQADTQLNFTNSAFGPGGLLKTGGATLLLSGQNISTGPTTVNAGTLQVTGSISKSAVTVNAATFDAASQQQVKSLTVNNGGTTIVTGGTLKVGDGTAATPLATSGNGRVDLRNNSMVVDYVPGSESAAMVSVRNLIVAGYNGGAWNGTGVASTTVAATPGRALGYAQASEIPAAAGGTFQGQSVDPSSVLVRPTLSGDATLDGTVDFNDLVKLAQNYNTTLAVDSWWNNGDFTYDGTVDFNDLVKLAQNYNTSLPGGAVPGAPVGFEADLAAAFAAVPEPGAIALLGLAGCAVMGGRQRRRKA
jgi:autotransporter-associated beta strand protein